ncbi:MAG: hypothetical protein AAF594_18650 [Bacteroidota bacterium]
MVDRPRHRTLVVPPYFDEQLLSRQRLAPMGDEEREEIRLERGERLVPVRTADQVGRQVDADRTEMEQAGGFHEPP